MGSFAARSGVSRHGMRILISLAASTALVPPAISQTPLDQLNDLQNQLSQKQSEMDQMQAQIKALRDQLNPATAVAISRVDDSEPICLMENRTHLDAALIGRISVAGTSVEYTPSLNDCENEAGFDERAQDSPNKQKEAIKLANSVSQPIPGRPIVGSGFSSNIEFGNDSRASLTYSQPIVFRIPWTDKYDQFAGFTPQLATLSYKLSTPIEKGKNSLLSLQERKDRKDLDVLSGTTFRFGFDFLQFEKREAAKGREGVVKVLYEAFDSCYKELFPRANVPSETQFAGLYAVPVVVNTAIFPAQCSGERLVEYILATKNDTTTPVGKVLIRSDLATRYQQSFWSASKEEVPNWGWGASIEVGTNDFAFRQAAGIDRSGLGTTDEPFEITFDNSMQLAASETTSKADLKATAYLMKYLQFKNAKKDRTPAYNVPGVMLLGSFDYISNVSFLDGTTGVTFCDRDVAAPPLTALPLFPGCKDVNISQPTRRKTQLLSLEARTRMDNVPYIKSIGFAPKISYRLNDDRLKYDAPFYLTVDKDKKLSSGVRIVHQSGGVDALGNPEKRDTTVSLFFSTLNFRGF